MQALEVIYSKAKAMERSKVMLFDGFRHALHYVSEDKNSTFADTAAIVIRLGAPQRKQLGGMTVVSQTPSPRTTPAVSQHATSFWSTCRAPGFVETVVG